MTLTPTKFDWPAGPASVQVSGDWDDWKEKISLDKQSDGSFFKEIPLAENKRVHYKFIVDDNWTTKQGAPTVDDAGNVNNIVDVGPASKKNDATTAAGVGAGAAAAVGGASAAAATKLNGHGDGVSKEGAATLASGDKKVEPAQPIKEAADADVRNAIPQSITTATRAAVPVVASAVATVTGADILRGNPEELPVSAAEAKKVQADAAHAQLPTSVGAAVTDASKAPTENAKAGANVSSTAAVANKLDTPVVPVTEAGFASNVDPTRNAAGQQGGEAAGAVASAGHSTTATKAAPALAAASPVATTAQKADSSAPEKTLPTTPKKGEQTVKSTSNTPSAPASAVASAPAPAPAPVAAPSTPTKASSGTMRVKARTSQGHAAEASTTSTTTNGEHERTKRKSFFGKIKNALSPHSSPSK